MGYSGWVSKETSDALILRPVFIQIKHNPGPQSNGLRVSMGNRNRPNCYSYSRTRRAIARPNASRTLSIVIRSKTFWKNPVTII